MDTTEAGLRTPLHLMGVDGTVQTLILAAIPLLTLIASVKLLRGFFRLVLVVGMAGAFLRITWPLLGQMTALA